MPDPTSGKTAVPIPAAQPTQTSNSAADRSSPTIQAKRATPSPPTVSIGDVNAKSTPLGMAQKRIPPRVNTKVSVTVANAPVTLKVSNQNGSNGTVNLNGKVELSLKPGSHNVNLKGVTQTSPGNANKLQVEAWNGATSLATSNTFSVSAIPQNWKCTFFQRLDDITNPASAVGFKVQDGWSSDSKDFSDLDQAKISEQIESVGGTGIFSAFANINSQYLAANVLSRDEHSVGPRRLLTKVGVLMQKQTSMFMDMRSGAVDIPVKNSGYTINFNITARKAAGKFSLKMSKQGADTTANGIASKAGKGRITTAPFLVP